MEFKAIRHQSSVIVLLDRHQGGSDEIKRKGYDFQAILSADDTGEVRLA